MIDWLKVDYFNTHEDKFSENPDDYAEPKLIYNLDSFRKIVGRPISPSPVTGALARFDLDSINSRHYAVDRESDAIDVFVSAEPATTFIHAISCRLWGGIGIYFDTKFRGKQHIMYHLDCRPLKNGLPVIWYRLNGKYFYPKTADEMIMLFNLLEFRE